MSPLIWLKLHYLLSGPWVGLLLQHLGCEDLSLVLWPNSRLLALSRTFSLHMSWFVTIEAYFLSSPVGLISMLLSILWASTPHNLLLQLFTHITSRLELFLGVWGIIESLVLENLSLFSSILCSLCSSKFLVISSISLLLFIRVA